MVCPVCTTETHALAVIFGLVRVSTHHCKTCHKSWREYTLIREGITNTELLESIALLKALIETPKLPGRAITKRAIWFMESKLYSHGYTDNELGLRRKKRDLQDRQYLDSLNGSDCLYPGL